MTQPSTRCTGGLTVSFPDNAVEGTLHRKLLDKSNCHSLIKQGKVRVLANSSESWDPQ
jgi:hypothetical protein